MKFAFFIFLISDLFYELSWGAVVTQPAAAPVASATALPMQALADFQLNKRIHNRLSFVRSYDSTNFTVFSQGGVVTIQGRVRNTDEMNAIASAARSVTGVNEVIINVIVDPNLF